MTCKHDGNKIPMGVISLKMTDDDGHENGRMVAEAALNMAINIGNTMVDSHPLCWDCLWTSIATHAMVASAMATPEIPAEGSMAFMMHKAMEGVREMQAQGETAYEAAPENTVKH